MPTRPRTGTGRTKRKTTPTVAQQPSTSQPSEVTAAHLERREIPSFSESREARIAEAAYWRAERRGFVSGQELDDWLAAEKEVDDDIAKRQSSREQD